MAWLQKSRLSVQRSPTNLALLYQRRKWWLIGMEVRWGSECRGCWTTKLGFNFAISLVPLSFSFGRLIRPLLDFRVHVTEWPLTSFEQRIWRPLWYWESPLCSWAWFILVLCWYFWAEFPAGGKILPCCVHFACISSGPLEESWLDAGFLSLWSNTITVSSFTLQEHPVILITLSGNGVMGIL